MRSAEEVLKSPPSFWVEFPHTERLPLTWQGPADQHYLDNVHNINVPLNKASDATLQSLHLTNGSTVQSIVDP